MRPRPPAASMLPGLPPPAAGVRPDLLVIAGEHSGDQHAAAMLREFLHHRPDATVCALGGDSLKQAGADLLFDLNAHSVVGLVEVLKNYRFFSSLMAATVQWIAHHKPRAVLMVDYPGFNLRLAKRLAAAGIARKNGGQVSLLYYISPQIWAWKARRRFPMAATLDALAVIFPFEVACYADTGLDVEFVGHPFVRHAHDTGIQYRRHGPLLLLPGSRLAAVRRIFPPMLQALDKVRTSRPDLHAVTVYPDCTIKDEMKQLLARHGTTSEIISLAPPHTALEAAAVLTSSGTMSLKCALAGIPGAIVYRAHPLTFWIAKQVVTIKHLGMANLLTEDEVYPEFLQGQADPTQLARETLTCLNEHGRVKAAAAHAKQLRQILTAQGAHPTPGEWLQRKLTV